MNYAPIYRVQRTCIDCGQVDIVEKTRAAKRVYITRRCNDCHSLKLSKSRTVQSSVMPPNVKKCQNCGNFAQTTTCPSCQKYDLEEGLRKCIECQQTLGLSAFRLNENGLYRHECDACVKERMKQQRAAAEQNVSNDPLYEQPLQEFVPMI